MKEIMASSISLVVVVASIVSLVNGDYDMGMSGSYDENGFDDSGMFVGGVGGIQGGMMGASSGGFVGDIGGDVMGGGMFGHRMGMTGSGGIGLGGGISGGMGIGGGISGGLLGSGMGQIGSGFGGSSIGDHWARKMMHGGGSIGGGSIIDDHWSRKIRRGFGGQGGVLGRGFGGRRISGGIRRRSRGYGSWKRRSTGIGGIGGMRRRHFKTY